MVAMYNAGAKLACNIAWGRYAGFAKREQKVETQIACRTGWVTAGPAEQLLKCGGRGGGLDGLLIYRKKFSNYSYEQQIYMLRRQGKFVCSLFTADRTVTLINLPWVIVERSHVYHFQAVEKNLSSADCTCRN